MMKKNSTRSAAGSLLLGLLICLGIAAWPVTAHAETAKGTVRVEKRVKQDPVKIQQGLERVLQRAYAQHRMLVEWKRKVLAAKAKAKARNKVPVRQTSRLASAETQR
ncbi:MAG: hypothetical protein HY914_17230 [Desulfomonile tiedjei]|nr:hypothetical protein [Desulfomonile tiedjei]